MRIEQSWVMESARVFGVMGPMLLVAGCGPLDVGEEEVTKVTGEVLTGSNAVVPLSAPFASESAAVMTTGSTGKSVRHVVAFNFDDPANITNTATNRRTFTGASL